MSEDIALLYPRVQDDLRALLRDSGFEPHADLLPETLAALAVLARHPDETRGPALMIMPVTPRYELLARRLIERHEINHRVEYELTAAGIRLADFLGNVSLELETPEETERAADDVRDLIAEGNRELELDD